MSKALYLVFAVVALVSCSKSPSKKSEELAAQKPTVAAAQVEPVMPEGQTFGAGVKLADVTPIDAILAAPTSYNGKTVRVEGIVTDVCPKRGCWFEMAGTKPGQKLRFKVKDGEMVFSPDAKGKKAVAEGVIAVTELTLEETKQRAEYEAKEYGKPYDPAKITEPSAVVRIDGTGAVLR